MVLKGLMKYMKLTIAHEKSDGIILDPLGQPGVVFVLKYIVKSGKYDVCTSLQLYKYKVKHNFVATIYTHV